MKNDFLKMHVKTLLSENNHAEHMLLYTISHRAGRALAGTILTFAIAVAISACAGVPFPSDPLLEAARVGKTAKVIALIDAGVDVNTKGDDGETALMWAAGWEQVETVRVLLEKGADVNIKDKHGVTALMLATNSTPTSVAIAQALLDKGAEVNSVTNYGDTALIIAVSANSVDVVRLLLTHGADVNAKTTDGKTALSNARHFGHTQIVSLLEQFSAEY